MDLDLVHGKESAVDIVRRLVLTGVPDMDLMTRIFSRSRFGGLVGKSSDYVDVFYVAPFAGSICLPSQIESCTDFGRFMVESGGVEYDANILSVYAIDSSFNVRSWARKVFFEEKDTNKADSFAENIAKQYGKIAVVDSPSSTESKGLLSVYFSGKNGQNFSETISREIPAKFFNKRLECILENILEPSQIVIN